MNCDVTGVICFFILICTERTLTAPFEQCSWIEIFHYCSYNDRKNFVSVMPSGLVGSVVPVRTDPAPLKKSLKDIEFLFRGSKMENVQALRKKDNVHQDKLR